MLPLVNSGAIFAVLTIIWCQPVLGIEHPSSQKIDVASVRNHISEILSYVSPANRTNFYNSCVGKMYTCGKRSFSGPKGFRWKEGITKQEIDKFWQTYHCVTSLHLRDCPVDGGWGIWTEWSNCTALCMETGTKSRERLCDNPRPARLGSQCSGSDAEIQQCQGNCLEADTMTGYMEAKEYLKEIHKLFPQLEAECVQGHCDYTYISKFLNGERQDRYWSYLICFKHHRACPIDGAWSTWSEWSSCSTPCGNGYLYRHRTCSSPSPLNGGLTCQGDSFDSLPCVGKTCTHLSGNERSEFTNWSEFGDCSASCGKYGTQVKTRTCLLSVKCIVNDSPITKLVYTKPCYQGECPVAGQWSDWSEWTECSAISGQGRKTRLRLCNNPSAKGDEICPGDQVETNDCARNYTTHLSNANVELSESLKKRTDIEEPTLAKGDPYTTPYDTSKEDLYTPWNVWSDCSNKCGGGYRSRSRKCRPEQGAGQEADQEAETAELGQEEVCDGETRQIQFCNVFTCPVNGGWSEWSEYSVCGLTCGNGLKYKHRRCDNPLPKHGGSCPGSSFMLQGCHIGDCLKSSSKWSLWSEWSECDRSCGGGVKRRVREVIDNKEVTETSSALCEPQTCPEAGAWSTWGQWSPCSISCNLGHHFRDRQCTDPAPLSNGASCKGHGTETAYCYPGPCGENEATVMFGGESYLTYSPHQKYMRFLLMYLRFKAMQPGGTILYRYKTCTEGTWECKHSLTLRVNKDWRLLLHIKLDGLAVSILSKDPITKSVWTDVQIGVTWQGAYIRVNDGEHVRTSFNPPINNNINFDANMIVGDEKNSTNGFFGVMSVLRINFKEQALFQSPYWLGPGAPDKQFMVTPYNATDLDVNFPDFRSQHYAKLEFHHNKVLRVMVALRLGSMDGLFLYNEGVVPDSYIALSLHKGVIRLCFTCSPGRPVCEETGELRTGQWYFLTLNQVENVVRLRVNRGDLEQVTCIGRKYRPQKTVYLGGVPAENWEKVTALTSITKGYDGKVDVAVVNGETFKFRRAGLFSYDDVLNSMGFSLAAHVNDVTERTGSRVTLRCDFTDFTLDSHKTSTVWLQGDRLVNLTGGTDFMPLVPGYRNESSLMLMPEEHEEGLYACLVNQDGRLLITHAFSLHRVSYPLLVPATAEWAIIIVLIAFVILIFVSSIVVLIIKRDTLKHFKATSKYERYYDDDPSESPKAAQMDTLSRHTDFDDEEEIEVFSVDERRHVQDKNSHQSEPETEAEGEYKLTDIEIFTESEKGETKEETEEEGDEEEEEEEEEKEEEKEEEIDINQLGSAVASRLIEENKDKVLELIASLGNISNLNQVSSKLSKVISSDEVQDSQSISSQRDLNSSAVKNASNTVAQLSHPGLQHRVPQTDRLSDIDSLRSASQLRDRRSVSKVQSHSSPQKSGIQGSKHSPLGFQNLSHDDLPRNESQARHRVSNHSYRTYEDSDSDASPRVSPQVSRRSISKKTSTSPSPRKSSMIQPGSPRSLSASISPVKPDAPLSQYETVKVNLISSQNDESQSQTSSMELSFPQTESTSGSSKPEPVSFGASLQRTPSRTQTLGLQAQNQPSFHFQSPTLMYSKQMSSSPGSPLYPTRPWIVQAPISEPTGSHMRPGPSSPPTQPFKQVSTSESEQKSQEDERSRELDSDSELPQPPTPPTD